MLNLFLFCLFFKSLTFHIKLVILVFRKLLISEKVPNLPVNAIRSRASPDERKEVICESESKDHPSIFPGFPFFDVVANIHGIVEESDEVIWIQGLRR